MLTFGERRQAQQPALFFPSGVFWMEQIFASNKHSVLLPAWECTDTWKALIAVGGFGDEESNLTMLLCFMLQGKSAGLEKRDTNWHYL